MCGVSHKKLNIFLYFNKRRPKNVQSNERFFS
nr:MAG TPA: hypothetical protein [Caudoviricetes sp.]